MHRRPFFPTFGAALALMAATLPAPRTAERADAPRVVAASPLKSADRSQPTQPNRQAADERSVKLLRGVGRDSRRRPYNYPGERISCAEQKRRARKRRNVLKHRARRSAR